MNIKRALASIVAAFLISPVWAAPSIIGTWDGTWNQAGGIVGTVDMTITGQTAGPVDSIAGYFDWVCTAGITCSGREIFAGTLDGTTSLFDVTGVSLVSPVNLGLGHYWGTLSADGDAITGDFSFAGGTFALGTWSVSRESVPGGGVSSVPEPGTFSLLAFCLAALAVARLRRKQGINRLRAA